MNAIDRQIERLQEKMESLWDQLHGLHEGFDEFQQCLLSLQECISEGGRASARSCQSRVRRMRRADRIEAALRTAARRGVKKVCIQVVGDGSALASVDGCGEFELALTLWTLLEILCEDDHPSQDGFVGFKTWDEIVTNLGQRFRKTFNRHSVQQNVSRLRGELFKNAAPRGGANPFHIQTRRDTGARFLLRSNGQLVIEGDGA